MASNYFSFKQFTIHQDKAAFKVGTDGVLLGAAADVKAVRRILDIGSGTGLVAIMLAQRCDAEIVALEPYNDSFIQCRENVELCRWSDRIKVENTSLQQYEDKQKFDLIVTNPPYYSGSMKNPDPGKAASRHNDSLSETDLLSNVSRLLQDSGRLQLILPAVEGYIFLAAAAGWGFYCNNLLKIRPLPSGEVRRLILTFSRQRGKPVEKFLTIESGSRHEYTEEYKRLTKDFYLNF
jgi:tRNA1Val (adenine37-N6)-methyltransferase